MSRYHPPLVEAFLCIEQPRQRLSHWSAALAPLDDHRAPPLAFVDAYYDPTCDQALIGLRYDELALGVEKLSYVIEIALLAGCGMIQPAELPDPDRRRFVGDRLDRCSIHVGDQRNVNGALLELCRQLEVARQTSSTVLPPRTATPSPAVVRQQMARGRAKAIDVHRAQTVEVSPLDMQRLAREGSAASDDPYMTPPPSVQTPSTIYARYLRSGRWVPVRVGAISLKGAMLSANALPRLQDHVDLALVFGMHRALVRGPVHAVSTPEETVATGASSFAVRFELDEASRRQLTTLLTTARAANVTIKPPPPRHARRYPVEWPVSLGTMRGAITGEALDVSREGLFVRPREALSPNTIASFSVGLDDGQPPICGRAKIVRHVTEADAQRCGLVAGYGLSIVEMPASDRTRWNDFMMRIERRADKRVLIGASPGRFNELQNGLAALGYAVTGGTDPGAFAQLASAEPRPVDAALIDSGWLTPAMSESWVESLFSRRNVPYVTMRGDIRRVRAAIDKLLSVT